MFTEILDRNPNTVTVGPNLNCQYTYHIQSFFIVFNQIGLDIMLSTWRCKYENETKINWVVNTEVVSK